MVAVIGGAALAGVRTAAAPLPDEHPAHYYAVIDIGRLGDFNPLNMHGYPAVPPRDRQRC